MSNGDVSLIIILFMDADTIALYLKLKVKFCLKNNLHIIDETVIECGYILRKSMIREKKREVKQLTLNP